MSDAMVKAEPRGLLPYSLVEVDSIAARLFDAGQGFYPDSLVKGKPPEKAKAAIAASIMYGQTLGMDPLTALNSVYVVHGRLGLYADAMAALVMASGLCVRWNPEPCEVEVQGKKVPAFRVRVQRKGMEPGEVIYSWADAVRAGLVEKNPNYKSNPQDMLRARAVSRACRTFFPDLMKGIRSIEELSDAPDDGEAPSFTQPLPPAPEPGATDTVEKPKRGRQRRESTVVEAEVVPTPRKVVNPSEDEPELYGSGETEEEQQPEQEQESQPEPKGKPQGDDDLDLGDLEGMM